MTHLISSNELSRDNQDPASQALSVLRSFSLAFCTVYEGNRETFCSRNPESGDFCLWNKESWALECGIQLKESRILLTIGIWDPGSTDKESRIQYLESGIHGVESRIQDGLGFLYMWRRIKCYDWKLCFLDSRNCYCRYLDTNVALETHISLLTDAGKTKFVSQCFSQILGEACLPLANTTIN